MTHAADYRSYHTLAEHPSDMVRLACNKCERKDQYCKAALVERYGADANLVDLRLELAAGCPKITAGKVMDPVWRVLPRPGRLTWAFARRTGAGFRRCDVSV